VSVVFTRQVVERQEHKHTTMKFLFSFIFSPTGAGTAVLAFLALHGSISVAAAEISIGRRGECENDKSFVFKKNKNMINLGCNYVAKKPNKRCKKTIDGEKVRDKCPLVCKRHACKCKNRKDKCKDISQDEEKDGKFCEKNEMAATYCPFSCHTCSEIMCDRPGMYGKKSALKKYNKYPDMVFANDGMYRLVEPETKSKQYLGAFQGSNDGHCPDTTDRLCVQKCFNEVKNCDSVTVANYNYLNDRGSNCQGNNRDGELLTFGCYFYNTQFEPEKFPMKLQPFIDNSYGLIEGFTANTYVAKTSPKPSNFVASLIIPPNTVPDFPNGSQDFLTYVYPAFVCVATNGGDISDCEACIRERFCDRNCVEQAKTICHDGGYFGEGGRCTERCVANKCLKLLQTAVLSTQGQLIGPKDPFSPGPYTSTELTGGCNLRDVYDPIEGKVLDPYTCSTELVKTKFEPCGY